MAPNPAPTVGRSASPPAAEAQPTFGAPQVVIGTRGFGIFDAPFLPMEISAFVDAGMVWDSETTLKIRLEKTSIDRIPVVSAGISALILLGGFAVLQFYYARPFLRPEVSWVTGFVIAPGW